MSRAIPAPTKGKKKAPPPPRPLQSIVIQQTISLDQPEQERPQNLMPIQNTPINPLEQQTAGLIRNAPKEEATLLPPNESLAEGQPARVQDSANPKQASNQLQQPQLEEIKVEKSSQSLFEGPFQPKTEEAQITIEFKPTIAPLPRKAPAPPKIKGVKKVPPPKAPILPQPPPLSSVEKATQQEIPKQIEIQKEPEATVKVEPPTEVKQTPLSNIQAPTQIQIITKKQQQRPIIQKPQLITPQYIRAKPLENREIQAPPKTSKPQPSRQLSPTKQLPGKSGISAKLQELRKAKEKMLREEPSDIEENQDEAQVSNNRSDFIKQNELQEKKEKVSPKEEQSSINETTPNPFQPSSKQGTQDNEAPAKKITPAPFKAPAARIAPPQSKKVAPPPILKSIPKPPEVKHESSNIEKQQSQIQQLLQPTDSPKTAEVNEKEGARKQQVQVKQIKTSDAVKNSVIIASPAEAKADIQIQKLLERYHSLKAGYLNNLRQLDQLIHFQKQQEDNQIDKINHLLSELHRRNESLKVICSSQELPSAETEELPI